MSEPAVVYEFVRATSPDGVVSVTEQGDLSEEVQQRVARPWTYFDEAFLYHDQAWHRVDEDGVVYAGYRVLQTPNHAPILPAVTWGPPEVADELLDFLDSAGEGELLNIVMNVRNLPPLNLPLHTVHPLAAPDLLTATERREQAKLERAELFAELSAPVVTAIESGGGKLRGSNYRSGWLTAEVPATLLAQLVERDDLSQVGLNEQGVDLHWALGDGARDDRMGLSRYHVNGHDGEEPNPARHSYNDVTIAIADIRPEDEACFFSDASGCSAANSRIAGRYECYDYDGDGNLCEPVSNFADNDSHGNHGTWVA